MRLSTFAAPVLALCLVATACSRAASTENKARMSAAEAKLKPAPDFSLKDSNGATVKLSEYRGKVVLLNFWATWCGPCKIEIPWFMDFEKGYKPKGFAVIGVAMDDDGWTAVKPYISEHKMNYRVLLGDDSVARAYGGVDALPTSFVITPGGRILASHVGLVNRDDYVKEIESLLETKVSSARLGGAAGFALLRLGPADAR